MNPYESPQSDMKPMAKSYPPLLVRKICNFADNTGIWGCVFTFVFICLAIIWVAPGIMIDAIAAYKNTSVEKHDWYMQVGWLLSFFVFLFGSYTILCVLVLQFFDYIYKWDEHESRKIF